MRRRRETRAFTRSLRELVIPLREQHSAEFAQSGTISWRCLPPFRRPFAVTQTLHPILTRPLRDFAVGDDPAGKDLFSRPGKCLDWRRLLSAGRQGSGGATGKRHGSPTAESPDVAIPLVLDDRPASDNPPGRRIPSARRPRGAAPLPRRRDSGGYRLARSSRARRTRSQVLLTTPGAVQARGRVHASSHTRGRHPVLVHAHTTGTLLCAARRVRVPLASRRPGRPWVSQRPPARNRFGTAPGRRLQ